MRDPYKNNSYLMDDKEQLRERMFFEENCKKIGKDNKKETKENNEEPSCDRE